MIAVELFPHETIYEKQLGTLFIFPELLGVAVQGLPGRGRHPVGGTLFITQLRLIFEAAAISPIHGTASILLDTLTAVRDTSAFLRPQITLTAGIPYELLLLQIAKPLAAIAWVQEISIPLVQQQARDQVAQRLVPALESDLPLRAAVRAQLDQAIATPTTVLRLLSLHNLWLSLGNAVGA